MKYILQSVPLNVTLGANAHERMTPQTVWVTVTFYDDNPKAKKTDNMADCIDYEPIYSEIKRFGTDKEFHTLEFLHTELKKTLSPLISVDFDMTILKKPFPDAHVFIMDDDRVKK